MSTRLRLACLSALPTALVGTLALFAFPLARQQLAEASPQADLVMATIATLDARFSPLLLAALVVCALAYRLHRWSRTGFAVASTAAVCGMLALVAWTTPSLAEVVARWKPGPSLERPDRTVAKLRGERGPAKGKARASRRAAAVAVVAKTGEPVRADAVDTIASAGIRRSPSALWPVAMPSTPSLPVRGPVISVPRVAVPVVNVVAH